jgi:5-methylcytosine-specific restriction endonuclease McrA
MAKRFTDSEKWKRKSFRQYPPKIKLLWLYILDDCDHVGLWHQDLEVASFRIGQEITEDEALKFLDDKIIVLDGGEKWFVPSFMEFQYGSQLSRASKMFNSIESALKKYDLFQYLTVEIVDQSSTKSALRSRISKKLKDKIFIDSDMTCQYCQDRKSKLELVVDHFIPLEHGGDNRDENLVCSCIRCNSHKTDIMPDEFLAKNHKWLNPTDKIKILSMGLLSNLKGVNNNLQTLKEKEQDKEELKEKVKEQFEQFWKLYERKGNKQRSLRHWMSLSKKDRVEVMDRVKYYVASTPEKKFRKDAERWLNPKNRHWEDEIINNSNQSNNGVIEKAAHRIEMMGD